MITLTRTHCGEVMQKASYNDASLAVDRLIDLTAEEARAFRYLAQTKARFGPWSDKLVTVMTDESYASLRDYWPRMFPGYASVITAFNALCASDRSGHIRTIYQSLLSH